MPHCQILKENTPLSYLKIQYFSISEAASFFIFLWISICSIFTTDRLDKLYNIFIHFLFFQLFSFVIKIKNKKSFLNTLYWDIFLIQLNILNPSKKHIEIKILWTFSVFFYDVRFLSVSFPSCKTFYFNSLYFYNA